MNAAPVQHQKKHAQHPHHHVDAGNGAHAAQPLHIHRHANASRSAERRTRLSPSMSESAAVAAPAAPSSAAPSSAPGGGGTLLQAAAALALAAGLWVACQCGLCAGASGGGLRLAPRDIGFLACALVLNTLSSPMVKLTQNGAGGYDYNPYCVYFFAELLKLAVAAGSCAYHYACHGDRTYHPATMELSDVMLYAVPGFVFFGQNNLAFMALQHMSSAAFQLLLNLRILAVAALTVVVLGKRLATIEWAAIALLTLGAMQCEYSPQARAGALRLCAAACGCVRLRAAARGCARLRVGA